MKRILIVDDEPKVRKILKEFLESAGYQVVEAETGLEGLKSISKAPCDLLITDIFMPDKDGFEMIMEVHRIYPQMKILVISGGSPRIGADMLPQAVRLGAHASLRKPILRSDLLQTVENLLQ